MNELKSCPICASTAVFLRDGHTWKYVECMECDYKSKAVENDVAMAVQVYNYRPIEDALCSEISAMGGENQALRWRIEALEEENQDICARIDKFEEALQKIVNWSEAYPLDIFPEPDWKKVAELLKDGGQSLDCVSAHNMRHVVEGVGKIARDALEAK